MLLSPSHRSGHKPGARVTNSARLFTPVEMRTKRSVKYINNRGRVAMVHGWTSSPILKIWRLMPEVEFVEFDKKMTERTKTLMGRVAREYIRQACFKR